MRPTSALLSTISTSLPISSSIRPQSQPFKRAALGLFHGAVRQSGNNKTEHDKKTRRTWLPNVHARTLHSEMLSRNFTLKCTAKALKTIRRRGGLDQYILNTRHEHLGDNGMRIRLLLRAKQEQMQASAISSSSSSIIASPRIRGSGSAPSTFSSLPSSTGGSSHGILPSAEKAERPLEKSRKTEDKKAELLKAMLQQDSAAVPQYVKKGKKIKKLRVF